MMIKPGGENLPAIKAVLIAVTVSSFTEKETVLWLPQGAAAKEQHGINKKGRSRERSRRLCRLRGRKRTMQKKKRLPDTDAF